MVGPMQSDEELMRAYVEGDPAAFRLLFERYGPILLNLTRRHLPSDRRSSRSSPADIFSAACGPQGFPPSTPSSSPGFFTIAMNLVTSVLPSQRPTKGNRPGQGPGHIRFRSSKRGDKARAQRRRRPGKRCPYDAVGASTGSVWSCTGFRIGPLQK